MGYIARDNFIDCPNIVGNGQCVTLVKALTGAPASSLWREGSAIVELMEANAIIASGSAIATFTDGRYPNKPHGNHAAIFLRYVGNGIEVFHQYLGRKPHIATLRFGRPEAAGVMRAELYSLVA